MSALISTERIFSLSCFEGLRLIRKYKGIYPTMPGEELVSMIESVEADAKSLDLEASIHLSALIEESCPLDGHAFYQGCIQAVLQKHQPIWAKAMRSGRRRFVKTLDVNDQDVFAAAGLMHEPPPEHVVLWWDSVSGLSRLISDQEKMEQGRRAEILTLERERERLIGLGIEKEPEWPGFDDNFAGYDVLSYDIDDGNVATRLIEVKSTSISPLRFFVTRNEWDKAARSPQSYIFHIWDMKHEPPVLHVRTVEQVQPHVPCDNGSGKWNLAAIPVQQV